MSVPKWISIIFKLLLFSCRLIVDASKRLSFFLFRTSACYLQRVCSSVWRHSLLVVRSSTPFFQQKFTVFWIFRWLLHLLISIREITHAVLFITSRALRQHNGDQIRNSQFFTLFSIWSSPQLRLIGLNHSSPNRTLQAAIKPPCTSFQIEKFVAIELTDESAFQMLQTSF